MRGRKLDGSETICSEIKLKYLAVPLTTKYIQVPPILGSQLSLC